LRLESRLALTIRWLSFWGLGLVLAVVVVGYTPCNFGNKASLLTFCLSVDSLLDSELRAVGSGTANDRTVNGNERILSMLAVFKVVV
jgi:hypothetical protein